MILLSALTLGLYQFYWSYRNWKVRKQATGENIWPLPRAIFSIFFVHSLFRAASDQRNRRYDQLPTWNHSLLATVIVILLILARVLDRLSTKSIGSPATDLLSLLILIPIIASFASAQDRINEACGDPLGQSNNRLTGANYVWMVIGLLIWALVGIGIFAEAGHIE